MKNTSKMMIVMTIIVCLVMIAGAVTASHMGISSTHIALGICITLCFSAGVSIPMIMQSARKDNK